MYAIFFPASIDPALSASSCGAAPAHVLVIVLKQLSRTVLLGLLAGVALAAACLNCCDANFMASATSTPLSTYCAALALFSTVAAVAALLPTHRALRTDPIRALRYD